MAESKALSLLKEVAKPMVSVVAGQVTEGIRITVDFESELNNLEEKIQIIASIVESMTVEPDRAVERWLRKVIRIIHNVENMMDVLAYEEQRNVVMERRLKETFSGKVRLVCLPLEWLYLRTKMSCSIRGINSDIEAVKNDSRWIKNLKDVVNSASSSKPAATNITDDQLPLQQVRRNVDTSHFVGRKSDVANVVNMLLNNPSQDSVCGNNLSVVAIVGFGGLGKTTLAKQVCENEQVKTHFSERIWISDLQDFNIEKILNKMVEFLGMSKYEDTSSGTTIRKLEKLLGGKRYLLVLDDVWNTKQDLWGSLRNSLEMIGGSKDSMILTTTRDIDVTKAMHASSVHRLSGLSTYHSWSLFEKIAFANGTNGEDFALKAAIGRNIVEKCKGVPLAIRSIAGILHCKRNIRKWKNIEESELWAIPQNETGVLPSLKLSYNHLSTPMLKKCFSLCAFTLKDRIFQKYELICRWMALGLIQNSSDGMIIMEDIGEEYFNELLSISFLLVSGRNELGEAIYYKLHDLVYDLARSIAMHERLYLEAGKKEENKALDIQYLTVFGHEEINSNFPDKLELQNIRSLDMFYHLPKGLLAHVKYLRVLCLEHTTIEVVPTSISKLKCLKYLDLEDNPIKVLPEGIMELYNLQSLILYRCKPLFRFPRGLGNLVNLRHLGLSFHLCPTEEGLIGQLSQLQTLPPLRLSKGGFQISELGSLNNMKGSLDIKGLELITDKLEAEKSKLSMKPRVEELRLSWDNDNNCIKHEEVLDGLRPNQCLKLLSIKGYGGEKFPSWLMEMNVFEDCNNGYDEGTLCNLMKIELIDCRTCKQLPTLGHLPCLKMLEIRNMEKLKQIGPEFYGGEELLRGNNKQASSSGVRSMVNFASLKKLQLIQLIGLDDLEEWCEPGHIRSWTGFPSLEVLVIVRCLKLRKAPNNFPMLKELIVKGMFSGNPLKNIMSNESSLSCLKKLEIEGVEELTHIPEEVGLCTSLEVLIVSCCPNLVWIPNLSGLGALREIEVCRNDGLKGAPEGLESCKSLEKVWIYCCEKVETLPDLTGLSRLRNLSILGMRKMISQPPEWLYNISSLRVLHIGTYSGLNNFPDFSCFLKITSLEQLYLYGWDELQSLPQQLQQFTRLKRLEIINFQNVEELPDWLGNLSSLQDMGLTWCKKLKKLPSKEAMGRLRNFRHLVLEECPQLEEALKLNGAEHRCSHL